ncbi:MAG TPA: metallophosphoesterase [Bryobacteraceae bacterium]|nr:metallophosphoesterase [Bryobacteraceae bacterium]
MSKLTQFRDPDLSLFQSAVDEIVARKTAGAQSQDTGGAAVITRPDPGHSMVKMATHEADIAFTAIQSGTTPPGPPPAPVQTATEGIGDQVRYCASLARNYAVAKVLGHTADADHYHALLTATMGDCDPGWAETAIRYEEFLASKGQIPYRVHQNLSDFVIDGKLPANARIAFVGDWGTGLATAKTVLAQIARKNPQVVIHMGDVYYAGTDFEMQNYFFNIWKSALDLTKIATYTLSGNHDMFSGGAPYYKLLDQLGQPASYFCLRNDAWQFLAIDTGFNDSKPGGNDPTFLHDTELTWLADKIQNRGNRRTVLLSHHQLFAAFEDICGKAVNDRLNQQVSPLLPNVDLWLWGHEHNLVIYEKYMGILARCIGHGAFPIGLAEIPKTPKFPEVPVKPIRLGDDGTFYNHGYVIMDLAGNSATLSYYQDSDEDEPQFTETLAATATAST